MVSRKSYERPASSAYYHSHKACSSIGDGVIYQVYPYTCSKVMGISGSTRTVQSLYAGPINVFFPNINIYLFYTLFIYL